MGEHVGEFLSRRQTAALLDLHVNTLARWSQEGRGPVFVKVGDGKNARCRYPVESVKTWLKERVR